MANSEQPPTHKAVSVAEPHGTVDPAATPATPALSTPHGVKDRTVIPVQLLTYVPSDWAHPSDANAFYPDLRRRERYRQAQDRWATEHGLGRGGFVQLASAQRGGPVRSWER